MNCPRCGKSSIRRSARRGIREGLVLRLARKAPFRCQECSYRFTASLDGHHIERKRGDGGIAAFLGLRRGQLRKIRLTVYSLLVIVFLLLVIQIAARLIPVQRPGPHTLDPNGVSYRR
jgi:hypothetical protein